MIITNKLSVGIIGGSGKTGSQFTALFRKQGFTVTVTGKATAKKNSSLLQHADIIIFALPLSSAARLIKDLVKDAKRKDQLLVDVSSLKLQETKAMLGAAGEVIGMHPLFGPSTDPTGELVLLCPARASKETVRSLQAVFKTMQIRTDVMTAKKHDELMGTVQVIPHLKSFLMADTLRAMKTRLPDALQHCTPTYKMEFNVISRFLDDHPDLYMPIIFRNPMTPRVLRTLRKTIDDYIRIAEKKDVSQAEKRYMACQKTFAPHLKKARAESEACIRTLLSLSS